MSYAPALEVTDRQRSVLEGWVRNPAGTTYRVIERARIVLMSAEGLSIVEQARRLGVDRQRMELRERKHCPALEVGGNEGLSSYADVTGKHSGCAIDFLSKDCEVGADHCWEAAGAPPLGF